jgi:hypothetical protein
MKASEVLAKYSAGERNFQGLNLRGQFFKGKNLEGADFSETDLRSTNFADANLRGVNFTGANFEPSRSSILLILVMLVLIASVVGTFFLIYIGAKFSLTFNFFRPNNQFIGFVSWLELLLYLVLVVIHDRKVLFAAISIAVAIFLLQTGITIDTTFTVSIAVGLIIIATHIVSVLVAILLVVDKKAASVVFLAG